MPSPCAPGQTRNRVTKSCRDKKKPGRKPGTRTLAKIKAKKIMFKVYLINNAINNQVDTILDSFKSFQTEYINDTAPGSILVAKHAKKIVNWYKQFKDSYEDMLGIKSIRHKHGNVFEIQFTGDDAALDSYLDIDEDSNYPITIKGINYSISGERANDE
jgi:hypothetical protein